MNSDNPQQNRNAPSQQRHPNQKSEGPQKEGTPRTAEVKPPILAGYHCRKPYTAKKHWLDYATFVIEIFGLVGLIIYASFTYGIWSANKKAADAAKEAAEGATKAANIAAAQLELSERPWVDANMSISGPFFFNVNGANISLKITVRNTGHSPALGVGLSELALFGGQGVNAASYRAQVCQAAEKMSSTGSALFPNIKFEQEMSTTIGKEDIENGKASKEFPGSKFGEVILSPAVVVCIAYRPTFKRDSIYHTAYVLELFKINSAGVLNAAFKIGEDVDTKHLFLRFHFLNAISAD